MRSAQPLQCPELDIFFRVRSDDHQAYQTFTLYKMSDGDSWEIHDDGLGFLHLESFGTAGFAGANNKK